MIESRGKNRVLQPEAAPTKMRTPKKTIQEHQIFKNQPVWARNAREDKKRNIFD